MSSGSYKRHDGFNPIQIKDGLVVRLNKNGTIRSVLGKFGNQCRIFRTGDLEYSEVSDESTAVTQKSSVSERKRDSSHIIV